VDADALLAGQLQFLAYKAVAPGTAGEADAAHAQRTYMGLWEVKQATSASEDDREPLVVVGYHLGHDIKSLSYNTSLRLLIRSVQHPLALIVRTCAANAGVELMY
jgi:hypothetical protein